MNPYAYLRKTTAVQQTTVAAGRTLARTVKKTVRTECEEREYRTAGQ